MSLGHNEDMKMYILTDKLTGEVYGRFSSLAEARMTLMDFYRLHSPSGRWLEVSATEPENTGPQAS